MKNLSLSRLLLPLILLIIFFSCDKVEFDELSEENQEKIQEIDLNKDANLQQLVSNLKGSNSNLRAINSSWDNLDTDRIVGYMKENGMLNYSIPIKSNNENFIEYLKIANRGEQYFGYVLQYEPSNSDYLKGFDNYTGLVRMYDLDGALLSTEFIQQGIQQENIPHSLMANQRMTDVENCTYKYAIVDIDMYDGTGSGYGSGTAVIVEIICDPASGGDDGVGTPIDGGPIDLGGDGSIGGSTTGGDGPGDSFGLDNPVVEQIIYIDGLINLSSAANTWLINNPLYTNEIFNFLNSNNSSAARNFAESAIESIVNGTYSEKQATLLTFEMANRGRLDGPYDANYFNWVNSYTSPNLNATPNLNVTNPSVQLLWVMHFARECAILKEQNPNMSDWDIYWEASKETFHLLLDLGGLVPVVGEVCDLTNAALYTIEGDGLNASLSTASAVPFAGWIASGVKLGYKGPWRLIVKTNGDIYFGARNSKKFREALGLVPGDGRHAHHLIPWSKSSHPLVQKAAKSKDGFHLNETLNGIPLPSGNHLTGHPAYNWSSGLYNESDGGYG